MIENYLDIEKMPAVKRILIAAQNQIKSLIGSNVLLSIRCIRSESPDENKELLIKLIEKYTGKDWNQIISKNRQVHFVDARMVYMYFAKHFLRQTLTDTAHDLGDRDHTTVIHGLRTIENLLFIKDPISKIVLSIKKELPDDF